MSAGRVVLGVDGSGASIRAPHWSADYAAATWARFESLTGCEMPATYGCRAGVRDDEAKQPMRRGPSSRGMDHETNLEDGMSTDVERNDEDGTTATRRPPRGPQGGGSPVYALGVIGALVYYWRRADDPSDRARAVGKALVWPAFVVHDLLQHLEG